MKRAPSHLGKAGRALWRGLVDDYHIDDPAGLTLVQTAAEALDRMKQAQKYIEKHGEVVETASCSLKSNPAVGVERDARNGMIAALRQLNLDVEPLRDRPGRPTR